MTKRETLAAIMLTVGMLLCLGAVGNGDYNGALSAGDYIRIAAGLALMTAALPISGDLRE